MPPPCRNCTRSARSVGQAGLELPESGLGSDIGSRDKPSENRIGTSVRSHPLGLIGHVIGPNVPSRPFIQSFGGLSIGTPMTSCAKLAQWAFTLELASLTDGPEAGRQRGRSAPRRGLGAPIPTLAAQEAVLRLLLRHGADVNETDRNGVTPLHRAVRFRSPAAVRLLLENGRRRQRRRSPDAVDAAASGGDQHRRATGDRRQVRAGRGDRQAPCCGDGAGSSDREPGWKDRARLRSQAGDLRAAPH